MTTGQQRLAHGDSGKQMAAGAATGDENFEGLGHDGMGRCDKGGPDPSGMILIALGEILKQFLNINQFPKPGRGVKFRGLEAPDWALSRALLLRG